MQSQFIELLRESVANFNQLRIAQKGRRLKLAKANLSALDLRGALLINIDLSEVDFAKSTLDESFFLGSNLSNADFSHCNARSCVFGISERLTKDLSPVFESYISKPAVLKEADFSFADLSGSIFKRTNIEWADFSNSNLEDANFLYTNYKKALFVNARICRSTFFSDSEDPRG